MKRETGAKVNKVLLIEDDLILGEFLHDGLVRAGYVTSWFVRARLDSKQDGSTCVLLSDLDGSQQALDASAFDLALVDKRLKGSPVDGPEVVRCIAPSVPVVAISGLEVLNQEMIDAGASFGIAKDELFSRLLNGARFRFDAAGSPVLEGGEKRR